MSIEDSVAELVNDAIREENLPYELKRVEYVRPPKSQGTERDWYLRIFIDKDGGVSIDDCQIVSELISPKLDAKDIIKDGYILEVSSPGID